MALFYWCISSFHIPNFGESTFTNIGERIPFCHLDFCQKESNMATVTSINNGSVIWEATNGNEVTFRVSGDIVLGSGELGITSGASSVILGNHPENTPELHVQISEDSSGSNSFHFSESLTVTMNDINVPVTVKIKVKENETLKKTENHAENPVTMQRPIGTSN